MEITKELGGCPESNFTEGSSPIIIDRPDSTKTFTRCAICGGELTFGSNDPLEGTYYWCTACNEGPVCFPLYSKPTPKIAPVVDAEELQRVLRSIREVPVSGYIPPSPHSFLDPVISTEKLDKIKERVVIDQKIAASEPMCDGCSEYGDCIIADEATALVRCDKLKRMRARAMR
jgi:hypothetical protein